MILNLFLQSLVFLCLYCKRQKLSERKVLRFNRFHSNVGKTFVGLISSVLKVLKKAIAQKIHQENFHAFLNLRKSQNFSPAQLLHVVISVIMAVLLEYISICIAVRGRFKGFDWSINTRLVVIPQW